MSVLATELIRKSFSGDPPRWDTAERYMSGDGQRGDILLTSADQFVATTESLRAAFRGPERPLQPATAFELRGERFEQASSLAAEVDIHSEGIVHVQSPGAHTVYVALRFSGGSCAMLPAIPGYVTELSFEDGRLTDVAFEPSAGGERAARFRRLGDDLRQSRALLAAALRLGLLRFDELAPNAAEQLVAQIIDFVELDPSVGLYGAYALHASPYRALLARIRAQLVDRVGADFLDVALLAGARAEELRELPPLPLLARGWALLDAAGLERPRALDQLPPLGGSLWTLFDRSAYDTLRRATGSAAARPAGPHARYP